MYRHFRSLLFVLLSFVFVSEAAAQVRAEVPPVTFSVGAGINVARLSVGFLPTDEFIPDIGFDIDNGSRIGFVAGGLVDFRLAPGVAVVTGGLVSTRGGKIGATLPPLSIPPDIEFPGGDLDFDFRMTYIDVPAFVAVGVARAGENRFEVIGGGMLGFKTQANLKVEAFGVSLDEDFGDELPAVDFGLSIGGRYICGHFFAAAYYTWGLTDLTEGDAADPLRHRYFTLLGGWRF